jgi:hypothetical protein
MSAKSVLKPYPTLSNGDMTGNLTSAETDVSTIDNIGIQANFTGSPVGTFQIQGSVDSINWVNLAFSTPPAATGTGDNFLFNIKQFPYPKIRVKYTATSGSGVLNTYITGKRLGG